MNANTDSSGWTSPIIKSILSRVWFCQPAYMAYMEQKYKTESGLVRKNSLPNREWPTTLYAKLGDWENRNTQLWELFWMHYS